MLNRARQILQDHGIAPSFQRMKILEYLLGEVSHPTAEMIFQGLNKEVPTLSKATVYNTLNLFQGKKLVSIMSADNHETRYDLVTDSHGHFVCRQCGEIIDFDYHIRDMVPGLEGFLIEQENIVLKGICNSCRKKERE